MARKFFGKKENIFPDWVIVGLGNPGAQYKRTRHNAGFMCIDNIAKKHKIDVKELKFDALCGYGIIEGESCVLVKPQTYMNLSGNSVSKFVKKYNIPLEKLIVISDDVSFDVGKMRVRRSGSAGGQKGLNNIIGNLQSEDFPRIKIGVGKKPEDFNMADWVLSNFEYEEMKNLEPVIDKGCQAVELILTDGIDAAMQKCN